MIIIEVMMENNIKFIDENYDKLMEEVKRVVNIVKSYLEKEEKWKKQY